MSSRDLLHRFVFEESDIRGEIVTLGDSYSKVMECNAALPSCVKQLLGEFVAAVSLMSSTLKFDGILTLQARGKGPVPLIMAECGHQKSIRAIAQLDEEVTIPELEKADINALLGDAVLAIIIEPDKGERYQGIVPLEGSRLADCLEHYFSQSEQLPTRFWFAVEQDTVTGLLLQALPQQVASAEQNRDSWETVEQLAATVSAEELLQLEHPELLYRLFNEFKVTLFEPLPVRFECSCSRERSAAALESLGRKEVEAILAEQDWISIDCQFCNSKYVFGRQDMEQLFGESDSSLH